MPREFFLQWLKRKTEDLTKSNSHNGSINEKISLIWVSLFWENKYSGAMGASL